MPSRDKSILHFLSLAVLMMFVGSIGAADNDLAYHAVERVVDGDTIIVKGVGRVRLIGVNTPETKDPRKPVEYFGPEASQYLSKLLEGKSVRLEYDQTRLDIHQRTLAYLYMEDGTFVNLRIVSDGLSPAYTKYPFARAAAFRVAEREARERKLGLWADSSPTSSALVMQTAKDTALTEYSCGRKTKCAQMKDCSEARYHLEHCGLHRLDADKDGIPCENLCRGPTSIR